MRARGPSVVVVTAWAGLVAACASTLASPSPAPAPEVRPVASASGPTPVEPEPTPAFVVADPPKGTKTPVLALDDGSVGVIVRGTRFVVQGARLRPSKDVPSSGVIDLGWRVPARLGGGFVFRAGPALYASDAFDGLLRPIVTLPSAVATVAFAPRGWLVRDEDGDRWLFDAAGRRLPFGPTGLLDVAALDDGRAAALVEGGGALVSWDGGARWTDVTARLPARPLRLVTTAAQRGSTADVGSGPADGALEGLWVVTQGNSLRVQPAGALAEYADTPKDVASADAARAASGASLRAADPRWREDDAPIRRALRSGVPLDERSALVVSKGDLVAVNVVTGAVDVVVAGRLPPDAVCSGMRVEHASDRAIFACRGAQGAFVVSEVLGRAPVVEQTFGAGRFVASDDGGLAFLGPCATTKPSPRVVCARVAEGSWQEFVLDTPDAGAPLEVVRWIPRANDEPVAVVMAGAGAAASWGMVLPSTGETHAWSPDTLTTAARTALQSSLERGRARDAGRLVDRAWSVTPGGALRGWADLGGVTAVQIERDGSTRVSPFTFERVAAAGAVGLARQRDGRLWQTLDHGSSWAEIATAPGTRGASAIDSDSCSLAGCDLGLWYRIGWTAAAPDSPPPPPTAAPAPDVDAPPVPTIVCRAAGAATVRAAARTDKSPEDLGLGAARLAVSSGDAEHDVVRIAYGRRIGDPVRDPEGTNDGAPRAILHGPATFGSAGASLAVAAADHRLRALVRRLSFVAPFDPSGAVHQTTIAAWDIVAAARSAGIAEDAALNQDPLASAVVPVTPTDPAAPDDVVAPVAGGALAWPRGASGAARVLFDRARGDWHLVSAVAMGGNDLAWLDEDTAGSARVMRTGGGLAGYVAFEIGPPPSASLYPANVDALAIGPRGEVAIVRTPSGREPPSATDPAVVLAPGQPPAPLAPWSTLTRADDAACKDHPGGWRATLQTIAPWVRLAGTGDLRGPSDAPMTARVRWSAERVCLEAIELRTGDLVVGSAGDTPPIDEGVGGPWDSPLESWAVVRVTGAPASRRVVVTAGAEVHQPLECTLGP